MTLRVLAVAASDISTYRNAWAEEGIQSVVCTYDKVLSLIQAPPAADFLFDAVVLCLADYPHANWSSTTRGTGEDALQRMIEIRDLPPWVAMLDGRQWRSLPAIALGDWRVVNTFGIAVGQARLTTQAAVEMGVATGNPVISYAAIENNKLGATAIRTEVEAYRMKVLSEFDDCGLVVQYRNGRYEVGPALKARKGVEGYYYFGPADRRPPGYTTTFHKDTHGLQLEVEQFEALINRPDVRERELQVFFEQHPHFLSTMHIPVPQVRLAKPGGKILKPDFVLRPIVAEKRDSRWQVIELKLPQEQLLSGKGARQRLSQNVMKAIVQLRDYKDHFEHGDADEIKRILGHPLRRPRLGVLIGRLANTDAGALEEQQRHLADVTIVTYDEILEDRQARVGMRPI